MKVVAALISHSIATLDGCDFMILIWAFECPPPITTVATGHASHKMRHNECFPSQFSGECPSVRGRRDHRTTSQHTTLEQADTMLCSGIPADQ